MEEGEQLKQTEAELQEMITAEIRGSAFQSNFKIMITYHFKITLTTNKLNVLYKTNRKPINDRSLSRTDIRHIQDNFYIDIVTESV